MPDFLTPRELQIVTLLAHGRTSKQIMVLLGISRRTVRKHVSCAREKLHADTREHMVGIALSFGLVERLGMRIELTMEDDALTMICPMCRLSVEAFPVDTVEAGDVLACPQCETEFEIMRVESPHAVTAKPV